MSHQFIRQFATVMRASKGLERLSQHRRPLHSLRLICSEPAKEEPLFVHYILANGAKKTCKAMRGDNLMDLAIANNIDIEGACGGVVACSTCHVVVQPEFFKKLDKPDEEELDMLDLAFGLTEWSRLGCQIKMKPELNNIVVAVPEETRDARGS